MSLDIVVSRETPRLPVIPHYGSGTGSRGGGWWALARRPYYLAVFDVAPALGFSLQLPNQSSLFLPHQGKGMATEQS